MLWYVLKATSLTEVLSKPKFYNGTTNDTQITLELEKSRIDTWKLTIKSAN